jgi:hypothetical protein
LPHRFVILEENRLPHSPFPPHPRSRTAATAPTALTLSLLNPRLRSLARGNSIVFASLAAATPMSGFPHLRENPLLVLPALLCLVGVADTTRCMKKRWGWYHGGVILCLYMDLMALTLILFFLLYPYILNHSDMQTH